MVKLAHSVSIPLAFVLFSGPVVGGAQERGLCGQRPTFTLLVHGGAGAGDFPADVREKKFEVMRRALQVGERLLAKGGTAVEAVVETVAYLEDSGAFNAGKGAIANRAGFVELDASVMTEHDRNAGAVAAVRAVKNPIRAALAVMSKSEHVMFVDRGAEAFAKAQGLQLVEPSYFLESGRKAAKPGKSGTVGAVALDRCGNLAGGTSTGGYTAKSPGRVGDSPVIGAGTFADNAACAVSATGWGEYFIRAAAAHDVAALVVYKNMPVEAAAKTVLKKIEAQGATGGLIVLDRSGEMAAPYTSKGMMRGFVDQTGRMEIGIFEKMKRIRDGRRPRSGGPSR